MPCDSSYMEPNDAEINSNRTARLINYVDSFYKGITPEWIRKAARDVYGNPQRLDELVRILCDKCKAMSKGQRGQIIYNAYNGQARDLADWWEEHQEADRKRTRQEREDKAKRQLIKNALAKLSKAERKALRLDN